MVVALSPGSAGDKVGCVNNVSLSKEKILILVQENLNFPPKNCC
jgi:hypothetical protein